jgi:hypothetical protein
MAIISCVAHAPSCPEDAESYAKTYAHRCPQVRTCLFEEPADIERLSRAWAPQTTSKLKVNNLAPVERKKRSDGVVRTCEEKIEGNSYRDECGEP